MWTWLKRWWRGPNIVHVASGTDDDRGPVQFPKEFASNMASIRANHALILERLENIAPLDWHEDTTFENGNYQNLCARCERVFLGHKRRALCRECARMNEK